MKLTIPVRTVNESNGPHGHWAMKAGRRKKQRETTRLLWIEAFSDNPLMSALLERLKSEPARVMLRRVSGGLLDTDALPLSMKSIRDELAELLGVTDAPTDMRVSWHYEQRKCKRGEYAVEVEIA